MPGTQDQDTVEPLSYTPIGEDGKTSPGTSRIPALRTSTPKQALPEEAEKLTSDTLSHTLPQNQALQHKNLSNLAGLHGNVSKESPDAELDLPPSEGSVYGESEKIIYASVDFNKKTPKESLDSGIDNQSPGMRRSDSTESMDTRYEEPWDRDETLKRLLDNKFGPVTLSTPLTLKDSSDIESSESDSTTPLISSSKKTNRIWPRAKYAMQQKGFVIFSATAIVLSTCAALVYLQDKAKFIAFFANSPLYTIVPIIASASLLAISPMFLGIKQFVNTKEYQTQGKNAAEVLAEVLEYQPQDKAIKSVRLEYSNGTHSNFVLNAWESKNDFINIDEKVVNRTNKIESVINNRPLFTTLLTGVGAASVALPLLLYAKGGVNNVQKFYQNPLISNIGLSLLISSGILALSMICLGVHYYRKTNCTNLIYSQEKIDPESGNKELIKEIKRERTSVLGENHSKDAKRISLTLERVVVQSYNCKDLSIDVSR